MKDRNPPIKMAAIASMLLLFVSSGCAMSPWRANKLAQQDPAQEYIERTAATVQYNSTPASYASSASIGNTDASSCGSSCCQ